MIAPVKQARSRRSAPRWHQPFLAMLPRICHYARFAFRRLDPEAKQEAVQCVVASALAAYVRLVQLNKASIAYAAPLAMYAIRQYRDGRRLGSRLNVREVSSEYAHKAKGIRLQRLDKYDREEKCWQEILIPDRTCTPADLAASRIDFPAFLDTLTRRNRKLALRLATGESTNRVAKLFRISAGRVSQLRRELHAAWREFHGETAEGTA